MVEKPLLNICFFISCTNHAGDDYCSLPACTASHQDIERWREQHQEQLENILNHINDPYEE